MYSKTYMQHFAAPQNIGTINNADAKCEVVNEEGGCFDTATLFVTVENNIIKDAKYQLKACSGTIMAFSLLTTRMIGKTLEEVKGITYQLLFEDVGGVPDKKAHSLRLAVEAKNKILEQLEV